MTVETEEKLEPQEDSQSPAGEFFGRLFAAPARAVRLLTVDPDTYNGDMGPERGELGPDREPVVEPEPESDPESLDRYQLVREGLDLNGADPEYLVVRRSGDVFVFMPDAEEVAGLSNDRVKKLIQADRIIAEKPAGWVNVVSVDSINQYKKSGKKKLGRPRKNGSIPSKK